MRALVVCNGGGIGDVLLATPVMHALRMRYSHITALTQAAHQAVIAPEAADEVWLDTPNIFALRARIAAAKFDASIVTWATLRNAVLLASAGVPVRVGQARRSYSSLFTAQVKLPSELGDRKMPWAQILMRYAQALDCDGSLQPVAPLTSAGVLEADKLLRELGLRDKRFVIMHPTRGISSQRPYWPTAALGRVGVALHDAFNLPILISGSAGEAEEAASLARRCKGNSIAGRVSLAGFAALAARAALVVAMDSGPMHIAAAAGAPTVGIFAMRPDEPDRWHPIGPRTAIVRPNYPCPAWHTKERCPDFACVRALDAERVVAVAAGLLDLGREAPSL